MRGFLFTGLVTALSAVAGVALADEKPPMNPDPMTVSGRFGIPPAERHLTTNRLRIVGIEYAPDLSVQIGETADRVDEALWRASEKSLHNHRLLSAGDWPDAIPITLTFEPVVVAYGETESLATGILHVTSTSEDPAIRACVEYTATGQFKALHRVKSGGARRIGGIMVGVLIASVNPYAINTFTGEQWLQADQENDANNTFRTVARNEGIAPGHNKKQVISFAAQNVVQLMLYDYINTINRTDACLLEVTTDDVSGPSEIIPEVEVPLPD